MKWNYKAKFFYWHRMHTAKLVWVLWSFLNTGLYMSYAFVLASSKLSASPRRKRATRRTACSCGPSSAAEMKTCLCLRTCFWRRGRYRELSPAPPYRTAAWPAAPETERARAPPRRILPVTATAARAVRAKGTAIGRPSGNERHPQERNGTGAKARPLIFSCAPSRCASGCGVGSDSESDSVIGWWVDDVTQGAKERSGLGGVT